jgi:hypothetical protein
MVVLIKLQIFRGNDEMNKSLEFLKSIFLVEPQTGEKQKIINVEGAEKGHDCLKIFTKGKKTSWVHKIYTEEI